MAENSLHSSVTESFPKSNKEIWKQAASREIEGKDPFDILSWKSSDGINFFPYYEIGDVTHLTYLKKFQLTVGEDSFSGPRRWCYASAVSSDGSKDANKISLEHLSSGADGIFFRINSLQDPNILLKKIEWPFCSLFFQSSLNDFFSAKLPEYISQHNWQPDSLTGALFWETAPKKGDVDFYLNNTAKLKSLGIVIQPASPVTEIAEALLKGVQLIEDMREPVSVSPRLFSAVAFSLPTDTRFFETIAKLKALRILWFQISQAYAIQNFQPSDLHIHVASTPWVEKEYEPHGNLIKSTHASMAAILGGCDSLTIIPQDEQSDTFSRMARNVSSILREEAHLNKVADPINGAYAVDVMTDAIARQAWLLFQSKLKS
jgi:methylmalonyl-CoA mutase